MRFSQHIRFSRTHFFTILCMAQIFGHAQRNLAKGDRYFDLNQFEEAIEYYDKDADSKKKNVADKALQKLADCYRITGNFSKAEETYKKIAKRQKKEARTHLNYGLSLKNSAKYAEAIEQLKEYSKLKPDDPMAKIYIQSCDSAQKWLDETIGKEVKNLKHINTSSSEFSPVLREPGTLVFSSSREGSTRRLVSFNGGGEVSRMDLYEVPVSQIDAKEKKKRSIRHMNGVNTAMHEGSASFSKDGNEIYFTKTTKGKRDSYTNSVVGTLQVFYSRRDSSGKWADPVSAFSFNSSDYSTGHPALAPDGKTIFFMSDKPGGYGKADIYYCLRQIDGSWGLPVNAGKEVNTFGMELFPAVSDDGFLFFSSDAHPGMGQLDIFKAQNEKGKWTKVNNLKPPVNSIGNDFGISFNGGHQRGFFSSDRFNGKGSEDIYSFTEELPLEIALLNDTLIFNDYSVYDDINYQLINETESKSVELQKNNGVISVPLLTNKTYILEALRYGMVHNQVFISYKKDSVKKEIFYKLATSHQVLHVTGKSYVGLNKKNGSKMKTPDKTYSALGNLSFGELEMGIDKRGFFMFSANLEPGRQNLISSKDIIRFEEE